MKQYQLYINGKFVDEEREMFDVINPSNGEVVAQAPKATEADVAAAVDAAYEAQKAWAKLPSTERAEWVRKIGQAVGEKVDFFARVIAEEQGKTLGLSTVALLDG